MTSPRKTLVACAILLGCALSLQTARAGSLRDLIMGHRPQPAQSEAGDALLQAHMQIVRDVPYGKDARQRFDVYAPKGAKDARVIFMVHGGGWKRGDKAMPNVVRNKVAHWVPKGFIVISANYRMLPDADPLEQARDVARAMAAAQQKAGAWGGDGRGFILMGHSAGAHLVALLAASPSVATALGAAPWKGAILLDSAALDVVKIKETRHMPLYDPAFGYEPAYWKTVSPFHLLQAKGAPIMAVCSSRRSDSVAQANDFVAKARALGTRASVLAQDMSHEEINERLGADAAYTQAVDAFIDAL